MKRIHSLSFLVLALILCMALMPVASAHRVHLQEQIGDIQIKVWYGGGEPMVNANVEVYSIRDENEELYLKGTTDEEGTLHFTPKIGISQYRVVAEQSGHKGEMIVDLKGGEQEAELPLPMRIAAGFGYLIGLAGAGMLAAGWKLKKQYENN